MLARGELRCIGATTMNEYKKYIEKDKALERRFQQVMVAQPTVVDTISILRGLKEKVTHPHSHPSALTPFHSNCRPVTPSHNQHLARPQGEGN